MDGRLGDHGAANQPPGERIKPRDPRVQPAAAARRRFRASARPTAALHAVAVAIAQPRALQPRAAAARGCDAGGVALCQPLTRPRAAPAAAQDEVSVPEAERCSGAPASACGGCTCAALPAGAVCAAPSAAARALLYDPRLPCPLRRVRGFACDVERAAADAAAAATASLWPARRHRNPRHVITPHLRPSRREAPPQLTHCAALAAVPPALPHAGAEWRSVLGIAPPTPLPCAPIRGEPPSRRAAALVAAAEAAEAAAHQPRSAAG